MRIDEALDRAAAPGPVLIAGPTASGKSALALAIAEAHGGIVVNADALQVYARWRILTARPSPADEARVPHALYGNVRGTEYSVGDWLRDLPPFLDHPKPVIVGGTGLYLTALTEGLAEIPPTPPMIRTEADARPLSQLLDELDPETVTRIDTRNRARVQRAWEVLRATGRPLAQWQDDTAPPLLPLSRATAFVLSAPPEDLTPRITARFDAMLDAGALEEVRANLANFDPSRPADRAIGAVELADYLGGRIDLVAARDRAVVATRQFAKRQRTWFRARMGGWQRVDC